MVEMVIAQKRPVSDPYRAGGEAPHLDLWDVPMDWQLCRGALISTAILTACGAVWCAVGVSALKAFTVFLA